MNQSYNHHYNPTDLKESPSVRLSQNMKSTSVSNKQALKRNNYHESYYISNPGNDYNDQDRGSSLGRALMAGKLRQSNDAKQNQFIVAGSDARSQMSQTL